jgi:hypothetical protein
LLDVLQPPTPSQLPPADATPALQLAAPHAVDVLANVQVARWVPSHRPRHVASVEAPAHAAWPACGAPTMAVQTPREPATLHASQLPAQAPSQQTPSTQFPVAHCAALVQAPPADTSATHAPPVHV